MYSICKYSVETKIKPGFSPQKLGVSVRVELKLLAGPGYENC